MIPERSGITVESTVSGEGVTMAVDEAAMAHIMNVLTDLYEDRELAVIREYSTNALDSHVEAGNPDPIRVTLPSPLAPSFIVRDFGVGLDAEDIRSIYSRYGASTKRGTNEAVGMLGLGCKSALAYCDQFTVTGYKDGQRVVVSVSRDERGAGTMTILADEPTDEPNGAEVSVPALRSNRFADKAGEFFSYWTPGTVLVNGEAPDAVEGLRLTDDLLVTDYAAGFRSYRNDHRHVIVMGSVAYPCELEVPLPYSKRLLARVPIGSVTFAPSREGLIDNAKTKDTLAAVCASFSEAADGAVQRAVDAAGTRSEALDALLATSDALGASPEGHSWRGAVVPTTIKPGAGEWWMARGGRVGNRAYSRGGASKPTNATIMEARKATWVTGFANAGFSAQQDQKVRAYLREREEGVIGTGTIITTSADAIPAPEWLEGVVSVSWEVVKAWKDPNGASATPVYNRRAGTYCVRLHDETYLNEKYPAKDLDEAHLYYVVGTQGDAYATSKNRLAKLAALDPLADLAVVPANRIEKFKRTFPKARHYGDALAAAARRWWARLPEDAKVGLASGPLDRDLASVPAEGVADDELARALRIHGAAASHREKFNGLRNHLDTATVERVSFSTVERRYPLIVRGGSSGIDPAHLLTYVNAIHHEEER